MFPEILAELLPVHYTSFKIHMEIADEIEVKYAISSVPTPHEMPFRHHTRKGWSLITKHCEQNTSACNTLRGARVEMTCLSEIRFAI